MQTEKQRPRKFRFAGALYGEPVFNMISGLYASDRLSFGNMPAGPEAVLPQLVTMEVGLKTIQRAIEQQHGSSIR